MAAKSTDGAATPKCQNLILKWTPFEVSAKLRGEGVVSLQEVNAYLESLRAQGFDIKTAQVLASPTTNAPFFTMFYYAEK